MIATALSYAFGFCVVSLIVFLIAYKLFPHKITAIEILIGVVVQICGVVMIYVFASYGAGKDTQILNGEVTGKYRDTVMCSHSYSCKLFTHAGVQAYAACRPTVVDAIRKYLAENNLV